MENKTARDRIESVKNYVKDHAPTIVTAAAGIVTTLTIIGIRKDLNNAGKQIRRGLDGDSRVVEQCIKEERDFTYLPGLGVHVHAAKPNLLAEEK